MSGPLDQQLVNRVRQLLMHHASDTITLEEISTSLQSNYVQYKRLKVKPFRKLVHKAYELISNEFEPSVENTEENPSAKKEGEEEEELPAQSNLLNNTMSNLYGRKKTASSDDTAVDTSGPLVDIEEDTASSETQSQSTKTAANVSGSNANNAVQATPQKRHNSEMLRSKLSNSSQTPKKFKIQVGPVDSVVTMADVGGMDETLKNICKMLLILKKPQIICSMGMSPPCSFLLHGPSGVGKTLLAHAIAGQLQMKILEVMSTELIGGLSGESEERIRDVFEQAKLYAPCVLFIDEIDAIGGNRSNASKDMERRMAAQLINCMDTLRGRSLEPDVVIIGATTRLDMLDPALRRVGRFEHEIALPIPDRAGRKQILSLISKQMNLTPSLDHAKLAQLTPGYVGADLKALVSRAVTFAAKRIFMQTFENNQTPQTIKCEVDDTSNADAQPQEDACDLERDTVIPHLVRVTAKKSMPKEPSLEALLEWLQHPPMDIAVADDEHLITMQDFENALKVIQPSAKREGFVTVPDVTWDDIGSLRNIREELKLAVLAPVKYPERLESLGLTAPSGVLLCGPPGCGKTLLAKAVANEAGINFISVKGPELMSMYVGESERAVRVCFQRARNAAPCVIFFDEFDSLCPKRSASSDTGSGTRIVNQLLTEMDGIEERRGVYILAATNRPDIIDPAVLRPGRLDTILYVGLPGLEDRIEILNATTKNRTHPMLYEDVCLLTLAKMTKDFTGADLAGVVRQASLLALKETLSMNNFPDNHAPYVCMKHFNAALIMLRPSVTKQDMRAYEKMRVKYAAPRSYEDPI